MFRQSGIGALIFAVLCGFLFVMPCHGSEAGDRKLLSDLDKLTQAGTKGDKLIPAIIAYIERQGKKVSPLLLDKINDTEITQKSLATYVWALGFAKDPDTDDDLIRVYENNSDALVKSNALRSLSQVATDEAGKYLLAIAKKTPMKSDNSIEPAKFDICYLLAAMQYEKALPEIGMLLKKDYRQNYWQMIFCFGKMGDKAVPYLISKLDDTDKTVRINSLCMLGNVLTATEATKPLIAKYWKEKDVEVKMAILSTLERTAGNIDQMGNIFREIAAKETSEEPRNFAQETVDGLKRYKQMAMAYKADKKNDRRGFRHQYDLLYKSNGKKGNIELLGTYSTHKDEAKLKQLCQKVLDRQSDECLHDYGEIIGIITMNRFLAETGKE